MSSKRGSKKHPGCESKKGAFLQTSKMEAVLVEKRA
jgi:hypothetical protein